jgi:hypothetical protein
VPTRLASALNVMLASAAFAGCRQTVVLDTGGGSGQDAAAGGDDGGGFFDRDAFDWCESLSPSSRASDVVLAVDHSGTMQMPFGPGTRLDSVQQQLFALVPTYQMTVLFGYLEFPGSLQTCQGGGTGGVVGCCAGDVFGPIIGAWPLIQNEMTPACDPATGSPACIPFAQRPTAEALSRARQAYMDNFDPTMRNRYVLLLTGGEPTCAPDGTPNAACTAARREAMNLINAGVKTVVVAIGGELGSSMCLDQIALSGGASLQNEPKYYLARVPADLTQILAGIVDDIAHDACHFDLQRQPAGGTDRVGLFWNNGMPVDRGGPDGWDFDNGNPLKITLRGNACDTYVTNPAPLELRSDCLHH